MPVHMPYVRLILSLEWVKIDFFYNLLSNALVDEFFFIHLQ